MILKQDIDNVPFGGDLGKEFKRLWRAINENKLQPGVGQKIKRTTGGAILEQRNEAAGDEIQTVVQSAGNQACGRVVGDNIIVGGATRASNLANSSTAFISNLTQGYNNIRLPDYVCVVNPMRIVDEDEYDSAGNKTGRLSKRWEALTDVYVLVAAPPLWSDRSFIDPSITADDYVNTHILSPFSSGQSDKTPWGITSTYGNGNYYPKPHIDNHQWLAGNGLSYRVGEIVYYHSATTLVPFSYQNNNTKISSTMAALDMNTAGRTWMPNP